MKPKALEIIDLEVKAKTIQGTVQLLNINQLSIEWGEIIGIVGESGSGKSILALTIMGLLPKNAYVSKGQIIYNGINLLEKNEKYYNQHIRGKEITMIFQDPMASLNPVFTVKNQMFSVIKEKNPKINNKETYNKSIDLLNLVKLSDPEMTLNKYPHELSGGMRQRVLIAMALSAQAKVLISDEATRALDVTIQAGILKLIKELSEKLNLSTLFISSNMALTANVCEKMCILYSGEIIEIGSKSEIIKNPRHIYTQSFLQSLPTIDKKGMKLPILEGNYQSNFNKPNLCNFLARCPYPKEECKQKKPILTNVTSTHSISCFKTTQSDSESAGV